MTSKEYGNRIRSIRNTSERGISTLMKRFFTIQMNSIKSDMERFRDPMSDWVKWDNELNEMLRPAVFKSIKASYYNALKKVDQKPVTLDIDIDFKTAEVMRRVEKVNDTTKKELLVLFGLKTKKGVEENIAEVLDIFKRFIASRAPAIGMTLSTASCGAGVDMAVDPDLYNVTHKAWRAFIDEDTRDAHAEADGQTVESHENFFVGGEYLRWPGDPYASPGNIINCRCYEEPV